MQIYLPELSSRIAILICYNMVAPDSNEAVRKGKPMRNKTRDYLSIVGLCVSIAGLLVTLLSFS